MKKIIFFAAIALSATGLGIDASAQDIILTKESQIIKAHVKEITEDQVAYTRADNPEGPVYKISASSLQKICFENGTEEVFDTGKAANGIATGTTSPAAALSPAFTDRFLRYGRGDVVFNGRKLCSEEMEYLMPYDLYSQARKGQKMRNVGKGLLIPGAVLTGLSVIFYSISFSYFDGPEPVNFCFGFASGLVGVPLLCTGVPLYCVGEGKVKKAVNSYNETCRKDYSLNIGSTNNGFGLYLNF